MLLLTGACPGLPHETVLGAGLDAGTVLEILRSISPKWTWARTSAPSSDKQSAQAKAEERRATAVARAQGMRARVVEAEVPLAMAEEETSDQGA